MSKQRYEVEQFWYNYLFILDKLFIPVRARRWRKV